MSTSRHYTDDELLLHYYADDRRHGRVRQHLDRCETCRGSYAALSDTLSLLPPLEGPERGDQYGLEVWQRIRHQLPDQEPAWWAATRWLGRERFAAAAVAALLVAGAFVAGRVWPRSVPAVSVQERPANAGTVATESPANPILLSAVADHLDKTERMLTDIMNVPSRDISSEQGWARDLLTSSRLYRQDAEDVGEPLLASVLDELERSLLEIVHSPSRISAVALEQLRRRIDVASLLFKVRVMSDELRRRQVPPADRPIPQTSTPAIS